MEEGMAIEHGMVTRSIERAQKKVEEHNFADCAENFDEENEKSCTPARQPWNPWQASHARQTKHSLPTSYENLVPLAVR